MARRPDKPGTYRLLNKEGGRVTLSGVNIDGTRVKIPNLLRDEALRMAAQLFPGANGGQITTPTPTPEVGAQTQFDDYGFPVTVAPETVSAVASALGVSQQTPTPDPQKDAQEEEKRKGRKKRARSLMALAATGWAAADAKLARWAIERLGCDPVSPSRSQLDDLADSAKDAFTGSFGDLELGPWTELLILTLGLPVSMYIQSPRKKQPEQPQLKSVP